MFQLINSTKARVHVAWCMWWPIVTPVWDSVDKWRVKIHSLPKTGQCLFSQTQYAYGTKSKRYVTCIAYKTPMSMHSYNYGTKHEKGMVYVYKHWWIILHARMSSRHKGNAGRIHAIDDLLFASQYKHIYNIIISAHHHHYDIDPFVMWDKHVEVFIYNNIYRQGIINSRWYK